jgi:hypothetical protein
MGPRPAAKRLATITAHRSTHSPLSSPRPGAPGISPAPAHLRPAAWARGGDQRGAEGHAAPDGVIQGAGEFPVGHAFDGRRAAWV